MPIQLCHPAPKADGDPGRSLTLCGPLHMQLRCDICFESFPASEMPSCRCGHRYCSSCWDGYCKSAAQDGPAILALRCPAPKCTVVVRKTYLSQTHPQLRNAHNMRAACMLRAAISCRIDALDVSAQTEKRMMNSSCFANRVLPPKFSPQTSQTPEKLVKEHLDGDARARYDEFKWRAFVDSNVRVKWCPSPGCSRAVECQPTGQAADIRCACGACPWLLLPSLSRVSGACRVRGRAVRVARALRASSCRVVSAVVFSKLLTFPILSTPFPQGPPSAGCAWRRRTGRWTARR